MPIMSSYTLRLVSKAKSGQQHFFDINATTLQTLAPSLVRVQTQLFGLSATNIAYCALGNDDDVGWWNCFPVPSHAPDEYKDGSYGIAPAWGYARLLESNISALKADRWLYGYLPTSQLPFDLEMKQSTSAPNHWYATNEHRSKIPPLYNRYFVVDPARIQAEDALAKWRVSLESTWQVGYLLNRFCFALPGDTLLHPSHGHESNISWTYEDSNLSSTLVLCLGAGARISRSFVHQLATTRSREQQPVGIIEVTEDKDGAIRGLEVPFAHKVVSYSDLQSPELASSIKSLQYNRTLVIDFGGRDGSLTTLTNLLKEHLPSKHLQIIGIGAEPSATTTNSFKAKVGPVIQQGALIFGTEFINAGAIEAAGESEYYQQMMKEFRKVLESELARKKGSSSDGKVLGLGLDERVGMTGPGGLEGVWTKLFSGKGIGPAGVAVDLRDGDA